MDSLDIGNIPCKQTILLSDYTLINKVYLGIQGIYLGTHKVNLGIHGKLWHISLFNFRESSYVEAFKTKLPNIVQLSAGVNPIIQGHARALVRSK